MLVDECVLACASKRSVSKLEFTEIFLRVSMMDYLSDSIGKMYKQLIPSAIGSMLTATVASLIDTIILSCYLEPVMLSSVSICMPIYMILNALALQWKPILS